ncbi:PTS system cellobiose-specific IIC component [Spiroplasma sabaudiense Ar-1343]|uniref:PTS system cellobiose-specific IIC component n=1 Tax=Spiroplasma sabaudiense Ar-1343 TaxID=1276257 RepID=W6A9V0_9MOLU|nr:PTS transporter subunit EIIC [Spiroplasma sabaudiense]AHI53812.1 PTS system cellobiose-specific IIC component [Spiroplasma sabaudiense Ar-1343]
MKQELEKKEPSKTFKEKWKSFSQKTSNGFVKFGSKIGSNKILAAIRDGFAVSSVPLLGAAFPVIIGLIFFQNDVLFGKIPGIKDSSYILWTDKYLAQWFWSIWSAATVPFTLYFVIAIGYFVSKSYLKNGSPLTGAIVTVAAFMTLMPFGINFDEGPKFIGTDGILLGVFVGLLAPYLFAKLMNIKKLRFKLPDSVPPVISEVFASIISITIVMASFSLMGKGWSWIAEGAHIVDENGVLQNTLFKAVTYGLGKPFGALGTSVWSTGIIVFFIAFFWFFGLHGSNILSPVTSIIWTPLMYENASYWKLYLQNPLNNGIGAGGNYWTLPITLESGKVMDGLHPLFNQMMTYIGGTGATLGLIIAILCFSKYKPYREISKLSAGPGVFGINEPMTFGIPMIFNVSYFIPYVIGFTFMGVMTHLFVIWHWVRPVVIPLGWTPFILQNLLMTGLDWRSVVFDIIGLAFAFGMWSLFLPIGERVQKNLDAQQLGLSLEDYNKQLVLELAEDKEAKRLKKLNKSKKTKEIKKEA